MFKLRLWYKRRKKRRQQRNAFKNAHLGRCSHCGGAWNWKDGATIYYYEGRGMFPICQDCFQELSVKEILYYCTKKWRKDMRKSKRRGNSSEAQRNIGRKEFMERALENIRRKKNGERQKYRRPDRWNTQK